MKKILVLLICIFNICLNQLKAQIFTPEQSSEVGSKIGESLVAAYDMGMKSGVKDPSYKYWGVTAGYGSSYGGYGVKISSRLSEDLVALGLSVGYGYAPDGRNNVENVSSTTLWSAGTQLYLEHFYVDFQIGEMCRVKYKSKEKDQIGAAFSIGYNWFFSKNIGLNAALGIAGPINWSEDDEVYINKKLQTNGLFNWEIGLIVKL